MDFFFKSISFRLVLLIKLYSNKISIEVLIGFKSIR